MEFVVRYFVEIELPVAAIETALDEVPAEWLIAWANKAHDRALGMMLEADPLVVEDLAGAVVVLGIERSARHGSTTIRTMAWALVGPHFGEAAFGRRSGGRLTGSPPHPAGGRGSL